MSAPTPNPDGKSFWTPRMLTATVVVAVIVIAGIILAITNLAGRQPDQPAATPAPCRSQRTSGEKEPSGIP